MRRGIIGIYAIKNSDDGKVYIGQSVDVEFRLCNHFSKLKWNRHDNEHMQRAFNKNPGAFSWEIICECKEEQLDELEIKYIREYESTNPENGYNRSYGGQLEHRATEETKRKMSDSKKGKKFTEEHCRRIGEANRRRKLSDETKRKIAKKHGVPIVQYALDGTFVARYDSKIDAAIAVGLRSANSIHNVLSGKAKQSAGYRWEYG